MNLVPLKLWGKNLLKPLFLLTLLESMGVLWFIVESTSFFSENISLFFKSIWWVFLFLGFIVACIRSYPKLRFSFKIPSKDVRITIAVTDLFKEDGDLIVASNSTFDTDIQSGIISKKSIQGQFTEEYMTSVSELDRLLEEQLQQYGIQIELPERKGKRSRYEIGTVCRVDTKTHTAYFTAISHMNDHGNAEGKFEYLQDSLPKIWDFISKKGRKETIRIPILGSGFSRISPKRDTVIMEIIKSFIASCSESTFCEDLIICIHPSDFEKGHIDLDYLSDFLEYQCRFTDFSGRQFTGTGTAL